MKNRIFKVVINRPCSSNARKRVLYIKQYRHGTCILLNNKIIHRKRVQREIRESNCEYVQELDYENWHYLVYVLYFQLLYQMDIIAFVFTDRESYRTTGLSSLCLEILCILLSPSTNGHSTARYVQVVTPFFKHIQQKQRKLEG